MAITLSGDGIARANLAADVIDSTKLADDAVNSEHLADGSIDAVHLSVNSVDSDAYVDASIDNAHLADDAVGVAELSATGTASSSTFLRGDNSWQSAADATKLPLAGGAMTGAITTNSTFDGVDIATRDGILTSTTTTAGAALPKAGGNVTGSLKVTADGTTPSGSYSGFQFDTGGTGYVSMTEANTNVPIMYWYRRGMSSQGRCQIFLYNTTEVGYILVSSNSTAYATGSDYRLKENVNYDWDATTRLKQLKPANFNFISDDTNEIVDGFLAHEVDSIVTGAVSGDKDEVDDDGNPVYQGIDHSKLVPLLVKTIQELEARITALES